MNSKLKIVVIGGTGLIGTKLVNADTAVGRGSAEGDKHELGQDLTTR
jgi:hypothetical protein